MYLLLESLEVIAYLGSLSFNEVILSERFLQLELSASSF